MKLLHTSDWHLGKRLEGFSRLDEQEAVLREICEIAENEQINMVIVAGDLFDTYNPATEAVELFYRYLKRLSANGERAIIAIAGNHDSAERIEAPDPLARECGIIFSGSPGSTIIPFKLESGLEVTASAPGFAELKLSGVPFPVRILMTPYANELRLKTYLGVEETDAELRKLLGGHWSELAETFCDKKGVNLLAAHLLFARDPGSLPEEPEEERPINYIGGAPAIFPEHIPAKIQYVALGHLHRQQTVTTKPCPVVYSGSPIAYSFSEVNQDKFVTILELNPGKKAASREILLSSGKKLLRERFDDIDKAVEWLNDNPDVFVELTIVSDRYLASTDRKRLLDAHAGIVSIIPESRNLGEEGTGETIGIDLSKGMEELFIDYFKYKKAQDPDERILNLFREVISEEEAS